MGRWAVGVLLYEICAGVPPFSDADQVQMFSNITSVKYKCPGHFSPVSDSPAAVQLRPAVMAACRGMRSL